MSPRDPDDPRLSPIRLRSELIAEGANDRAIQRLVAGGILAKVRHGAYIDGRAWEATDNDGRHELRTRAVVKQARTDVVVSHVSGLPFYGASTWGQKLDDAHITRKDGKTGRREAGVAQHRGKILGGDVMTRHGIEVMAGTRLALEITAVADLEPAFVAVSDLLHLKHATLEQLQARYALGIERWEGTLATDLILRLADPRMESVGEYRSFLLFHRLHLPRPEVQYKIPDRSGNVFAIVDFAWPELGVFGEFDGKIKYTRLLKEGESITDVVLREKRREEEICEVTGWRPFRVIWDDLYQPQHTAQRARHLLSPTRRPA